MRTLARACAVGAATLVLIVGGASPAFAHAALLSTEPAAGATLDAPPTEVVLRFSEGVETSGRQIRVFDAQERRVDSGDVTGQDGNKTLRLPLGEISDGTHVVTWSVVSADGHPIRGAFTFVVGAPTTADAEGLTARLLSGETGGSTALGASYAVARFVTFAGLLGLVGVAVFAVAIAPSTRATRTVRVLLWTFWSLLALGTVVELLVEGPYLAGATLAQITDTSLLGDALGTQLGRTTAVRLLVAVASLPIVAIGASGRPLPKWWPIGGAVSALVLTLTFPIGGHARTGRWTALAIPADTVHLVAASVWLGGVIALLFSVRSSRAGAASGAVSRIRRFSQVAFYAVAVLVATGVFQTVRQVGSLDNLWTTDYGKLLLAKLAAVGLILVAASVSRQIVNRELLADGDDGTSLSRLRGSVMTEVVLAVAVLGATSLLVNAAPARVDAARPRDFSQIVETQDLWFDIGVSPARPGPTELHITALRVGGAPTDVLGMEATLTLAERDVGPLQIPLRRLAPGHYFSPGFQIPYAGDWEIEARALVTDVEQVVAKATVPIR